MRSRNDVALLEDENHNAHPHVPISVWFSSLVSKAALSAAILIVASPFVDTVYADLTYQSNLAFDFNYDTKTGDYSFISLNGGVNVSSPPIAVSSTASGNWSDAGNWTSGLAFGDAAYATEKVYDAVTGILISKNPIQVFTSGFDLGTLMVNQGPTERTVSLSLPLASGSDPEVDAAISANHLAANFSAATAIQYDVTIAGGDQITMNQPNVIVHSLYVASGGSLIGNGPFTVRTDLINSGTISNLQGTIQGNYNSDGGYADVTGPLSIQGTFSNYGTVAIESGTSLTAAQPVTNNGTLILYGGAVSAPGPFTNSGTINVFANSTLNIPFNNTGGTISVTAGTLYLAGGGTSTGGTIGAGKCDGECVKSRR